MSLRLAGKRALVTGAGTGIGKAIALEFAREGADVALHYSHASDGAMEAAAQIRSLGRVAEVFAADFTDLDQAERLADQALRALGGIDCLVNNAGITFTKPFAAITPEQFDALMSVNMRAPFFLTQRLARQMIDNGGGAVCNISSVHGVSGGPGYSAYAATKGAVVAFTRALAVELAHKGVRVNGIAPGWVTVENYAKAIPDYDPEQEKADAARMIPAGRAGTPEDVAKLAAFVCSGDAGFLIGETIVLDGGSSALLSLKADFRAESSARWGTGYLPGV